MVIGELLAAMRGRWVAQEPPVGERRVERRRVLVAAALNQRCDRRIEVVHERDHVDYRLGRQARDGRGPEVV
jgi:hypothetical protein